MALFDAENIRRIHYDAIGYISMPPVNRQQQAMYERMAVAMNEQTEAEMNPWIGLVQDIVQMFEHDEHFTLAVYEDVMARAKELLATVPEMKEESANAE